MPSFRIVVVEPGDTLTSIARRHDTTTDSIAFWNREAYPSLDPDSSEYDPDRIEIGWMLRLIPGVELDPETLDPAEETTAAPSEAPVEGEDIGA
jgi:hypothetical protein